MRLYVDPQLYLRLRCGGDAALPGPLADWARAQFPRPVAPVPVTIDYRAPAGWWRLADEDGSTIVECAVDRH